MNSNITEVEEHAGFKKGDVVVYISNPRSIGKIIAIYCEEITSYKFSYKMFHADVLCLTGKINRYSTARLNHIDTIIEKYQIKLNNMKLRKEMAEKL